MSSPAESPPADSGFSPPAPTTTTSPSPSSSSNTSIYAAIAITAIIAVTVVLVVMICVCKKKKRALLVRGLPAHNQDLQASSPKGDSGSSQGLASGKGSSQSMGSTTRSFSYAELEAATSGFSKENLLGEGGFGCVYKGVLLSNAGVQEVAVKQLKRGASQGEKEFQAEVQIISRVHHRHLVSLVGYCITDNQRLLVYDYVANNTLEYHLHIKKNGGLALDWPTRLKIARGAARGLAYLHEDCHPRIIHRDIKSANILLDNNFDAQVSDFGLAKLVPDMLTHVSTRIMGTFGYLAPEYVSSGKVTEKSDVFSFGVVLLELVTGRRPLGQESQLVEWARPIFAQIESEKDLEMLVDPCLNGVYDSKELLKMVEAAAACVRQSAPKRPRMGEVVRALEEGIISSSADVNKGLKPSEFESGNYSADITRFRRVLNEDSDSTGVSTNPSEYNQSSLEIDGEMRRQTTVSSSSEFSTSK